MSDPVPDEDEDHGGEGGDGDSHEDADRRPQEGRLVPVLTLGGTLYHGVVDIYPLVLSDQWGILVKMVICLFPW